MMKGRKLARMSCNESCRQIPRGQPFCLLYLGFAISGVRYIWGSTGLKTISSDRYQFCEAAIIGIKHSKEYEYG